MDATLTTMTEATDTPTIPSDVICVEHFRKAYNETIAVAGLSFCVQEGQIVGMVGPNGAGKTTTMRAIAGILPATRGTLRVAGHDVVHDSIAAKRALAYVPDDPKLFEALTVWEHLQFIASMYDITNFAPAGEQLLEQFELVEKRDTLAQELSRGMRQKVAIACAYLHNPRALMLDEPMTGLDPRGIRTMKQTVRQRAEAGAAVIISSHLLALVEDLCTHLLIMNRGERLFYGTIDEARREFARADGQSSLEDVFFHITEGGDPAPDVSSSS
jgi:ABC-2 type transport system ATP-binding protein